MTVLYKGQHNNHTISADYNSNVAKPLKDAASFIITTVFILRYYEGIESILLPINLKYRQIHGIAPRENVIKCYINEKYYYKKSE